VKIVVLNQPAVEEKLGKWAWFKRRYENDACARENEERDLRL
jgi:hypothetical protein